MPFPKSIFVQTGRFQAPRKIGEGAHGQVYAAVEIGTGRLIAVKEAISTQQDFETIVARFDKEVSIQASLHHPNIITVFYPETDPQSHDRYLICEYANGGSLASYLEQYGVLSEEQAIRVTLDICAALNKTWSKGIVHCDVKPGNIFLVVQDDDPSVIETAKLGDFSIALDRKEMRETRGPGSQVLGSRPYLSPEQEQGLDLDVQSDIYSLGITLWEMLTGQEYKLLAKKGRPNLQTYNPTASPAIATIIRKATHRDCLERYETPQEMIQDLNILVASKQASQNPLPALQRRFSAVIAGIAVLAIVGLTGGGWAIATMFGGPSQFTNMPLLTVEPSMELPTAPVLTTPSLPIATSLRSTTAATPKPPITSTPTPIPTRAASLTPEPPSCRVVSTSLKLRGGPGTVYPQLADLPQGTLLTPLGLRADGFPSGGRWLYVQVQGGDNKTGWVSGEPGFSQCNSVVVFDALPTNISILPTPTNIPTSTPTPTHTPTSTPTSTPTPTNTPTSTPSIIPTPQVVDVTGHWYAADGDMTLSQDNQDRAVFSGTFTSGGITGQIRNGKISRGSNGWVSEDDPWILTGEYRITQNPQKTPVQFQWEVKPDGTTFKGNGIAQSPWCGSRDGVPFEEGCSVAGTWSITIGILSDCSMIVGRTDLSITGHYGCTAAPNAGEAQFTGTVSSNDSSVIKGTVLTAIPPQRFEWNLLTTWDSFHGWYGDATSSPQNQFCGWRNGQSRPSICGPYLQ